MQLYAGAALVLIPISTPVQAQEPNLDALQLANKIDAPTERGSDLITAVLRIAAIELSRRKAG